jgi:1-acyl-sn-glycerol-3-phosphate acyltransferase
VSFLDGPILSAICKRPVRYVIDKGIYEQPVIHYFMRHNRAIPILPKKEIVEAALEQISLGLQQGDVICIFPEGRITYTGELGHFRPGIEAIIARDPVPVIPIGLHGLWGSIFSRKYLGSPWRFVPCSFPPRVRVEIGYVIPPEKVKVEKLHKIVGKLLERAAAS